MRKLFISITTVSVLLLAFISTPAQATTYDGTNGTVDCTSGTFTIVSNVVTDHLHCTGVVTLPSGVTSIGPNAFSAARLITSITIPASVVSIGSNSFGNASSLATVTFEPSSRLTSIGTGAFSGTTSLTSIAIPASVTSIGDYPFLNATSLATMTFGSGSQLASIGSSAFSQTALTSIVIPASVTSIGRGAFGSVSSLSFITVAVGNANYSDVDGVLFNLDKSLLVQYPIGKTAPSYSVPAGVTAIGAAAFTSDTALTSITIPNSVTSIGASAFSRATGLTSITIPNSVTSIGDEAFSNATSLASISLPASITSIGDETFYGAISLRSLTIPAGITTIGSFAFYGTTSLKIVTFELSSMLASIGYGAFMDASSLTSITLPASVTSVGDSAFYGASSLTSITLPASVTSVGKSAFYRATSLQSVYFFGNAPTIGSAAFSNVAATPNAYIKSGATGYAASGSVWNDLTVTVGFYLVAYNSNGGSVITSGLFGTGGSVSAPTLPTKAGTTFAGWSATNGGPALTFPYSPSETADIVLYALWTAIPVSSSPTPAIISEEEVAASEKEIASRTLSAKKKYSLDSLAKRVSVKLISPNAKVSLKVAKSSNKICSVSGTKLKTLKAGKCKVTFIVQEPMTKNGKKPKATKTTKVLIVRKRSSLA